MRAVLAALFLVSISDLSGAEITEKEKLELQSLHWLDAKGFHFKDSKSSIVDMPGFQIISGAESRRLREIVDGRSDPQQEAEVYNRTTDSELVFEWFPEGFISSSDWPDVDSDNFLSQMKALDVEANKLREAKGFPTLTTTGWRSKPQLNQDTHTISWSINATDSSGGHVVNSVALKLGRYGFEKIVWIVDPAQIVNRDDLLAAINNHEFDAGSRYTDYVAGTDRSAEYGVAGLVAGALGVKVLNALGVGAIILGLKKFAFLLLFPIIYLWRNFMGLFRRKSGPLA
jgi:uncharacterized membrane-anchored protein